MLSVVTAIAARVALADPISVGDGANQADVVIEFGDGALFEFDVSFDGTTTGLGLFDIIEDEIPTFDTVRQDFGFGVFIDGISFEGHSNAGYGGGENWWHYWLRDAGEPDWVFASIGVGDRMVTDGDADGWVYGRDGAPVPEPSGAVMLGMAALIASRPGRHARRGMRII